MKSPTLSLLFGASLALAGCGGGEAQDVSAPLEKLVGDAGAGEEVFMTTCIKCHAADATGIEGSGTNLKISQFIREKTDVELMEYIKKGREMNDPLNTTGIAMPPYGANPLLTDQDLANVVAYLRTVQQEP